MSASPGLPPQPLESLRAAMEGAIAATLATVSSDGTPNVACLSQVEYVDPRHIALPFLYFNRSRSNAVSTRHAALLLVDPATAMMTRLQVRYLRTDESGPVFERMKARLDCIASCVGSNAGLHLHGCDVYEVESIDPIEGRRLPAPPSRPSPLPVLRDISQQLAECIDLGELCRQTLMALDTQLGLSPAMLLLWAPSSRRLISVATRGYPSSYRGADIALGEGAIGVAARDGVPIRLGHLPSALAYGLAMRQSVASQTPSASTAPTDDPCRPGLAMPRSQMAMPLRATGRTLGVLFVESMQDLRFKHEDEDALALVAAQLAACLAAFIDAADAPNAYAAFAQQRLTAAPQP